MAKKRAEFLVYGYVQGVGFRYFVYRNATNLGLTGYAKNMLDGTVYVVAEGEEEKLQKLYEYLRVGSSHSYIEKVDVKFSEFEGTFQGFNIR